MSTLQDFVKASEEFKDHYTRNMRTQVSLTITKVEFDLADILSEGELQRMDFLSKLKAYEHARGRLRGTPSETPRKIQVEKRADITIPSKEWKSDNIFDGLEQWESRLLKRGHEFDPKFAMDLQDFISTLKTRSGMSSSAPSFDVATLLETLKNSENPEEEEEEEPTSNKTRQELPSSLTNHPLGSSSTTSSRHDLSRAQTVKSTTTSFNSQDKTHTSLSNIMKNQSIYEEKEGKSEHGSSEHSGSVGDDYTQVTRSRCDGCGQVCVEVVKKEDGSAFCLDCVSSGAGLLEEDDDMRSKGHTVSSDGGKEMMNPLGGDSDHEDDDECEDEDVSSSICTHSQSGSVDEFLCPLCKKNPQTIEISKCHHKLCSHCWQQYSPIRLSELKTTGTIELCPICSQVGV
eukprot:CAMPEP_0115005380 /NCGR_PEP_ID=MMETSP0216-20121206/19826_1 /TAXON_ID=223996 /ORGANISM="Protocruzia adherens, Strain Boccale" /LENGTH=401 /DNA_ID=CAMNT_0002371673 /DNA_START=79 /DNA_END=1284 /DNA_ORIENTATION=+